MRDRWLLGAILVGVAALCSAGLALGHHLATVRLVFAAGAGLVLVLVVRALVVHRRLVRRLETITSPTVMDGTVVRVGPLGEAPFVAGLRHPTIFCDERLPEQLAEGQVRAVLLHERAHQRAGDPARLVLLGALAPLVRRLPGGSQWLAATLARREVAADRDAIRHGASRADLAGALLALPPLARAHVAGFTPAVDLRLQVLLGDRADVPTYRLGRTYFRFAVSILASVGMCAWFLHDHVMHAIVAACC